MPPKHERLDNLQIIRAIAMFLVLFIHIDVFSRLVIGAPSIFNFFTPGGDAGVDIFFVLSGFIIFYVHRQDIGKRKEFIPYIIKRFSRIYPTYWVASLLIISLHFLFPQFGAGNETQLSRIIFSLFLIPSTQAPIIHAAWTLIYEVLFYISFGLLILFGFKKWLPFTLALILLTSIGWFYSINNAIAFQQSLLYIFLSYHNFEFLLGILGAYLIIKKRVRFKKTILILGIIILFLMLLFEHLQGQQFYALRLFGFGIPAFFIITSLSALELDNIYKTPKNIIYRLLLFLGNASFSIYLTHQVLISGAGRILLGLNIFEPTMIILLTTILTLGLGSLFHTFVEKPLMTISKIKLLHYFHQLRRRRDNY